MNSKLFSLIEKLEKNSSLETEEYEFLVANRTPEAAEKLSAAADSVRRRIYGNSVFVRGLIEISNICKYDCFYCGIRKSNSSCERYRLTPQEILACCEEGYGLGFRTFVMQGGEDGYFTDDRVCEIISEIKRRYPDCAVTLSLGEKSRESYQRLYDAGADRYLLRHETANEAHYALLHPEALQYSERMRCLYDLRSIGFQTGCGFMVGSPFQTAAHIAQDLKFIEQFKPDMCGIGPFIPHKDTPFRDYSSGTAELTCYLLSIIRLIHPPVLLPSTTALATLDVNAREKGIAAGANVVMPNLSPVSVREKYELYNNKIVSKSEAAQSIAELRQRIKNAGYEIVTARGDIKK